MLPMQLKSTLVCYSLNVTSFTKRPEYRFRISDLISLVLLCGESSVHVDSKSKSKR